MPKPFTFRMRAYAAAHFEWGDILTVTWLDMEAKLQSEYTGGEDGRAYPVTIHGEIRGLGDSLEEAEPRLAGAIGNTLPLIALAGNAAVADPLAVASHGLDVSEPQQFIGYRTPAPSDWFPPGKRRIEAETTHALMAAVGHSEPTDLLHRAIEAYRRALGHWTPEQKLLAGEFLFVAAETLSRFMLESRAASQGLTPKNLARLEKVANQDVLRRQYLSDEIFDGDAEAFAAVEEASNGFEHGYMSVDEVRGALDPVLDRSMGLVRRALIVASGVASDIQSRLLSEDYEKPRGLVPAVSVVRGELDRQDPAQPPPAAMDGAAVELEWNSPIPVARVDPTDGEVSIDFPYKVKVTKLPPNVGLTVSGFGMRAAHVRRADDEPLDVEFIPADEESGEAAPR